MTKMPTVLAVLLLATLQNQATRSGHWDPFESTQADCVTEPLAGYYT